MKLSLNWHVKAVFLKVDSHSMFFLLPKFCAKFLKRNPPQVQSLKLKFLVDLVGSINVRLARTNCRVFHNLS